MQRLSCKSPRHKRLLRVVKLALIALAAGREWPQASASHQIACSNILSADGVSDGLKYCVDGLERCSFLPVFASHCLRPWSRLPSWAWGNKLSWPAPQIQKPHAPCRSDSVPRVQLQPSAVVHQQPPSLPCLIILATIPDHSLSSPSPTFGRLFHCAVHLSASTHHPSRRLLPICAPGFIRNGIQSALARPPFLSYPACTSMLTLCLSSFGNTNWSLLEAVAWARAA